MPFDAILYNITKTVAEVDYSAVGPRPTRLEASVYVEIAGRDMTKVWDTRLLEVTVLDAEQLMDEATIVLDDGLGRVDQAGHYAGRMLLPQMGEPVGIAIGWPNEGSFKVFNGYVYDLESTGQRRSGRRLEIQCRGPKQTGKVPTTKYWGDGDKEDVTLKTVMSEAGKAAGYEVTVDPSFDAFKQKYWVQHKQSFHALGDQMAQTFGGVFKIDGDKAVLAKGGDTNPQGQDMPTVRASVGFNVLGWKIKPFVSRPVYGETRGQWFDKTDGTYKLEKGTATGGSDAFTAAKQVFTSLWEQTKNGAKGDSAAAAYTSTRMRGEGWIVIDGEPTALSNGKCILTGSRPGVDGTWKNRQVEHQYTRGTGYTTRLDVIEPYPAGATKPEPWWDRTSTADTNPAQTQATTGTRGDT